MHMKKIITPIILSTLLFSTFVLASNQKETKVSDAAIPSNYYASINSNMKGDTLKVALYNIIKGHTKIDYDSLEPAMKVTDRDYILSPLGTDDDNPYVVTLYADYNGSKTTAIKWGDSCGGYNVGGKEIWNKEHIWAKSNGFATESKPAHSDLHHLRVSDERCNNLRGNLPFNNVSPHNSTTAVENHYKQKTDNYRITNSYFEPRDADKGDVARALFYMATRYYNGDGSNSPLSLTTGTDSSGGKWGYLDTLLAWHEADPVDEFEMHRNDLIYTEFQHNRNPYIDHPEYARAVFKNEPIQEPDVLTNLTYTGTPTKTSYKEGESFNPAGLTVTATFKKEDTTTYTSNVTDNVEWAPNPLTKSTTSVTGSYTNGDVTKYITINGLTVSSLDAIRISGNPTKAIYEEGDTFVSSGLNVYAIYGQEEVDVTNTATWSTTPLIKGQTSVCVSYGKLNASYTGILVKEKALLTATVEFKKYDTNSGDLTASTIQSDLVKGKNIVTVSAATKAYKSTDGPRFGSGSGGGSITLTMKASTEVSKLIINAKVYGSDKTTVLVSTNGSSSGSFEPTSSFADYEITVNKTVTTITIGTSASNKRFYLHSVDIVSGSGSGTDSITAWGVSYLHIGDSSFDGPGTGLCKSQDLYKYAKVALFNLNTSETGTIAKLQSDSKYSNEYNRYMAWAKACEDDSPLLNTFEFLSTRVNNVFITENSNTMIIVIVIATTSILAFTSLLLIKKRRQK